MLSANTGTLDTWENIVEVNRAQILHDQKALNITEGKEKEGILCEANSGYTVGIQEIVGYMVAMITTKKFYG